VEDVKYCIRQRHCISLVTILIVTLKSVAQRGVSREVVGQAVGLCVGDTVGVLVELSLGELVGEVEVQLGTSVGEIGSSSVVKRVLRQRTTWSSRGDIVRDILTPCDI